MSKRTIDQWTWDYWLVKCYVKLCYRIFYRKVEVSNIQNIPKNQPIILASNHQNALMDALAFVCNTSFQSVFIARSDIFKGKILVHFLNFLNIMPIYRIRDGIDNVRRNDEVFDKTMSVLRNKYNPIAIFPEGNHGDKRRLRPLVKGIFRMAFMGQEDYGESKGVKIVPVGIDYGHYTNFRSTVYMNIGKPIEISEYFSHYSQNKVRAINELKERLSIEISKLIIDIQNDRYYDLYMHLRTIYNSKMRNLLNIKGNSLSQRFVADKKMIEILDKQSEENAEGLYSVNELTNSYIRELESHNIRDWVVEHGKFLKVYEILKIALLGVLSPLFLLGLLNNFIPYKIPEVIVRKIKDKQFHSSFKFVLGIVLFPLYYLILGIVAGLLIPGALFSWLYIVLMPLTGFFAYKYYIWVRKIGSKLRFLKGLKEKNGYAHSMIKQRREIISIMDHICSKYLK